MSNFTHWRSMMRAVSRILDAIMSTRQAQRERSPGTSQCSVRVELVETHAQHSPSENFQQTCQWLLLILA